MDFIPYQLNIRGQLLDLSRPVVMAVINMTPDSFYAGSRSESVAEVIATVEKALREGATIIDVGAYSSRPSAQHITEEEELDRLKMPLNAIRKHFPEEVLAVDTFRSGVARRVVTDFGVDIINDIGGGTLDDKMFEVVGSLRVPYIMMHMRGTPQSMQDLTNYDDMMVEIIDYFQQKTVELIGYGVNDIIIDPGFGFAKTLEQNYELLAKMGYLKELGFPILMGVSRKSMVYNLLGIGPEEALNGTTALHVLGLLNGASVLRVHDVKEAIEAIEIVSNCQKYSKINLI